MKHHRFHISVLVLYTSYFDPKYLAIVQLLQRRFIQRWIIYPDVINSGIIFRAIYISRIIPNFERNWKNLICIRVNNFPITVNCCEITVKFRNLEKLQLSNLEQYSLCGKVNFSATHSTHITIYSFGRTMFSSKVL